MSRVKHVLKIAVMALFLVWTGVGLCAAYAEEETLTVDVDVQFDQTGARSMLQLVNEFRTSTSDAWYLNKELENHFTLSKRIRRMWIITKDENILDLKK